jgi:hypothetical protein
MIRLQRRRHQITCIARCQTEIRGIRVLRIELAQWTKKADERLTFDRGSSEEKKVGVTGIEPMASTDTTGSSNKDDVFGNAIKHLRARIAPRIPNRQNSSDVCTNSRAEKLQK